MHPPSRRVQTGYIPCGSEPWRSDAVFRLGGEPRWHAQVRDHSHFRGMIHLRIIIHNNHPRSSGGQFALGIDHGASGCTSCAVRFQVSTSTYICCGKTSGGLSTSLRHVDRVRGARRKPQVSEFDAADMSWEMISFPVDTLFPDICRAFRHGQMSAYHWWAHI